MKNTHKIFLAVLLGIIIIFWASAVASDVSRITYVAPVEVKEVKKITHAQEAWLGALEWCESRGKPSNINPKDKDNTPSYYSFQFKPGTFRYYGEMYGVIDKGLEEKVLMEKLKSYDLQRKIVENMIGDKKVKWENEFPGCTKKNGRPPAY